MEQFDLTNYIKYALGYINLTRQSRWASQKKHFVEMPGEKLVLTDLLNGDLDGRLEESIQLPVFYNTDPKDVTEEDKDQYEQEKKIANKLEDLYNQHRNNEFTKQILLNFGYFEIEIPLETEGIEDDEESSQDDESNEATTSQIEKYPLFSFPVKIQKKNEIDRYSLIPLDAEVIVNIGVLEKILGENLYYQLVESISQYELEGKLSLPFENLELFNEIWHKVKAQLKLTDAQFNEESFQLEAMKLTLSPKANFFLAEDLLKLSKIDGELLQDTSLTTWSDENEEESSDPNGEITPSEQELYFPFKYDRFKLQTLKLLNSKAAIIEGPPGTGKSETIANLLCHLAATGNKILFVSQKAQALKVVKDKLKSTNLKYLFGYIPNPASAQLSEEDEIDGIAPQLAGLENHVNKLLHAHQKKQESAIESVVENKNNTRQRYKHQLELQRKFYELHTESIGLQQFSVSGISKKDFETHFSKDNWEKLLQIEQEIARISEDITYYESDNNKKELDIELSQLPLAKNNYSTAVQDITNDVKATGFDRRSRLMRAVNNKWRNVRLNKKRNILPREIIEHIDKILKQDASRNTAVQKLNNLTRYLVYQENHELLKKQQKAFEKLVKKVGLNEKSLRKIKELAESTELSITDIKGRLLRAIEIEKELKAIKKQSENLNNIRNQITELEQEKNNRIIRYIENIINEDLVKKVSQGRQIRKIISRLAKAFGKSKRAFKTFDNLRKDPNNFKEMLGIIPVWIMELDDASRLIPLEQGLFDYVILDEASQCNIAYTLPTMFRAKHALFVGDSEQMRDNTVMFKSNVAFDELAKKYRIPEHLQIKASGTSVQSVLDIAKLCGFKSISLRYHYRSPRELIGFSNKYFYKPKGKELLVLNNNYLTYEDTNRVIITHRTQEPEQGEETSSFINKSEANKVWEIFTKLRANDLYANKSIGILTFFNSQATYIREVFEQAGYREDEHNYKISIIDGIQGDEKDIIIYSFVIHSPDQKKRYLPLAGEGGDVLGDINKGRVNVAFSRARQQVHCVTSMDIADIPEGIWIKKYLEYAEKYGEVTFLEEGLKPFDSHFEEDFYNTFRDAASADYLIYNQFESCGFRIDFVIHNKKTGRRLAVECDGPTHFKNELQEDMEVYIEDDVDRQMTLESAGWHFYRIKYSEWIDDKIDNNSFITDIQTLLES